jgi:hypothetical protein
MAAKKRGGSAPLVHSVAGKRVLGHATAGTRKDPANKATTPVRSGAAAGKSNTLRATGKGGKK